MSFEEFIRMNKLMRKFQSLLPEQKEAILLMMEGLIARKNK